MQNKSKTENYLKNRLLVPIGNDSDLYFPLLDKFKDYIGGVYIGWPGAASGRMQVKLSEEFFGKVYRWCLKNKKVFDIIFNSQQTYDKADFFERDIARLKKYRSKITELTFYSVLMAKKKDFADFKKNISVLNGISSAQQIYELNKKYPRINAIVLDRNINRNSKLVDEIIDYAATKKIKIDLLVNEGCIPFCPHAKEHAVHMTASEYVRQKKQLDEVMEICLNKLYDDPANLLKSPFLTREALQHYKGRFFKLCDRTMHPSVLEQVLAYYAYGTPADMGLVFSVVKSITGITTDLLPDSFHGRILVCKNECYKCKFCSNTYSEITKKR